jgi:hypothetical protein
MDRHLPNLHRQVMLFCTNVTIILSLYCLSPCFGHDRFSLEGEWEIKSGNIGSNYEMEHYQSGNSISFHDSTVQLASGFFYKSFDVDEGRGVPVGMYPFVYYGDEEVYRLEGDSLFIKNTPYKNWYAYNIKWKSKNELELAGDEGKILLTRRKKSKRIENCDLLYVIATVKTGDLVRTHYQVKIDASDSLYYIDYQTANPQNRRFALPSGSFVKICRKFSDIDLFAMSQYYSHELNCVQLEFGYRHDQVIRTEMCNYSAPDKFRIALVPMLYGYQRFVHSQQPAIR